MSSGDRATRGQRLKYQQVFTFLEDDELYTSACIADQALAHCSDLAGPDIDEMLFRQRIRITMGRLADNHRIPRQGDGLVTRPGQPPTPGWHGRRWKNTVNGPRRWRP